MDADRKNAIGGTRLSPRNREIVRAHALEGQTLAEIASTVGVHVSRVGHIVKMDSAQRYAAELQAEHAARVRGKVRAMADAAAAVIASHLDPDAEVADYVRSGDARFVLEKTGFPSDEAPLVEVTINPRLEFNAWLSDLPSADSRGATEAHSVEHVAAQNGNGNGSCSSRGA